MFPLPPPSSHPSSCLELTNFKPGKREQNFNETSFQQTAGAMEKVRRGECGMVAIVAIIQQSDRRIAPWRGQKIATDKLLIHGEGEGLM